MSATLDATTRSAELMRCLDCESAMGGLAHCHRCGRSYPEVNGVIEAIRPLTGRNRIAKAFYDGPTWSRFQPWESLFLWFQGPGRAAARRQVLRHLRVERGHRVLEVGIGDGANVPLLPTGCEIHGVDFAPNRLRGCLQRVPGVAGRLVLADAGELPFEDGTFDAVFTVGLVNYVSDPFATLAEMKRVARPGARLVAADENPDLYRLAPGHALGLAGLDVLSLRLMGLDRDFVNMVLNDPGPVPGAAALVWPGHRRFPIWNRLGYCLVDVREG